MSRKRIKQYLVLLAVVGLIAVAANGSGTFASFSAQVTNSGNTFKTGSLLLTDSVNGGTACNSASGTGNVFNCTSSINLTGEYPGKTNTPQTFDIQNIGTIAGSLQVASTGCSPTQNTLPGGGTFNTGNLCNSTYVYVQENDSSGNPIACLFGPTSATNTCQTDMTNAAYTSSDSINALVASLPGSGGSLSAATSDGGTDGGHVQFVIGFYLPDAGSGDNAYQDLTATIPLTWTLTQT